MKQIMDGCTAATHVAYALSDVATIYPITPVASMGETAQKWGMAGRKNYMGATLQVKEMESELGVAGATHGALAAGSLATTFTNSQGLMLMLPNMFKIAGNRLPAVFHVGARSLATHALSIFGDHSDVMATRSSGFTYLASANIQETMDLALVAHLAAVEGSLPVCHFFDGWRTSNQMATIDVIDYADMMPLVNRKKILAFRNHALNPDHPSLAGSAQNSDVFFQNSEASNSAYDAFPAIVQQMMDKVGDVTGRHYHLFDYVGDKDAEVVMVSIGSSCEVIESTLPALEKAGYKVGVVKVRLFRPFSAETLMKAIPMSAHTIVALDRTKEPGAEGEPLFKDVATATVVAGRTGVRVLGCRYGLASKEFSPAMVKAIVDEAMKPEPKRFFTVGINDDVTHLSLDVDDCFTITPVGSDGTPVRQAIFYGMGSDGTVGATKQAARIIGNSGDLYAQAYFSYSAKKSGGYTTSQLRISNEPITAEYNIEGADYVACHKDTYVKRFELLRSIRPGGVFVLNCGWTDQELSAMLPAAMKRKIAGEKIEFYVIDAQSISQKVGLGVRINMIMETVFFYLSGCIPFDKAVAGLKEEITSTYMHEGGDVVQKNIQAVDMAAGALRKVNVPEDWMSATDGEVKKLIYSGIPKNTADFFKVISEPCLRLEGDSLPVSVFASDGHMPMGTTAFEKRRIAIDIPQWDPQKCVQCTECSLVCAHAAIRPFIISPAEIAEAPSDLGMDTVIWRAGAKVAEGDGLRYRIQVYPEDCTGCGSCAAVCPGHALTMVPASIQMDSQIRILDFIEKKVALKENLLPRFTVAGSQLHQPLLQFSGACAGCGETPYVKLLTQLFGERMLIANATGCSSIWGANYPSNAYCARQSDGRGPAWGNSLFEDNAEYGYGMAVSCRHRRETLASDVRELRKSGSLSPDLAAAIDNWLAAFGDPDKSFDTGKKLIEILNAFVPDSGSDEAHLKEAILANADMMGKKSVWAIGGDGWAYDIGFAGIDHVLASGEDINILVMDTECYSNTGGQTSKATPLGAVTKYSPDGKRTYKKDMGRMMMSYGTVYVAQIALGADFQGAIEALREAEAYPGPSIVIAYCPCINHGIRAGMSQSIIEERKAVEAGYWQLYRYNPLNAPQRLSPYIAVEMTEDGGQAAVASRAYGAPVSGHVLTVDYPRGATVNTSGKAAPTDKLLFPQTQLDAFLDGEDRYADITMVAPGAAPKLRSTLSLRTNLLHTLLDGLSNIM